VPRPGTGVCAKVCMPTSSRRGSGKGVPPPHWIPWPGWEQRGLLGRRYRVHRLAVVLHLGLRLLRPPLSLCLSSPPAERGTVRPACTGHPHPLQLHPAPHSHLHKLVPFAVPCMRGLLCCWRARAALLPSPMLCRLPWHVLRHLRYKGSHSTFASPKHASLCPRAWHFSPPVRGGPRSRACSAWALPNTQTPFPQAPPSSRSGGAGDARRKANARAHRAPRAFCALISCFLPHSPTAAIISSGLHAWSCNFAPWGTVCQRWSLLRPGKEAQGRPRGAEDGEKRP